MRQVATEEGKTKMIEFRRMSYKNFRITGESEAMLDVGSRCLALTALPLPRGDQRCLTLPSGWLDYG